MEKKGWKIKLYVRSEIMKIFEENEIKFLPRVGEIMHVDGYIIKVEEIVYYDKSKEIILTCSGLGKE